MFPMCEIGAEYLDLIWGTPSVLPMVPEISTLGTQPLWLRQDPGICKCWWEVCHRLLWWAHPSSAGLKCESSGARIPAHILFLVFTSCSNDSCNITNSPKMSQLKITTIWSSPRFCGPGRFGSAPLRDSFASCGTKITQWFSAGDELVKEFETVSFRSLVLETKWLKGSDCQPEHLRVTRVISLGSLASSQHGSLRAPSTVFQGSRQKLHCLYVPDAEAKHVTSAILCEMKPS